MRKHLLITGVMLVITTPAFANPVQIKGSAAAAAASRSDAVQGQQQRSLNQQSQSTTVGAGAGAAANTGNAQTVNVGGSSSNYSAKIPVSSAIAPSVMTVNPCGGGAASGAFQVFGFGASAGGSVKFDRMCQLAMYSQNPYAFAYACHEIDDFREMALEAARVGYAPRPCPQDAALVIAQPTIPPAAPEPPPVKRWAVVPCHMPLVKDRNGRCVNPNPPRPTPVCKEETVTVTVKRCIPINYHEEK